MTLPEVDIRANLDSTASSCCDAPRPVLALNCMMNSTNSTTGQRREAGEPLPSPRVSPSSRHPESLRLAQGEGSALPTAAPVIMSTWAAKLDSRVTHSKQTTSHFLIDNFCAHFRLQAPKSTTVRRPRSLHSLLTLSHSPLVTSHSLFGASHV